MTKEEFRKIHYKAVNDDEDVMKKFYNILSNQNSPVKIANDVLDRIIKKNFGTNFKIVYCKDVKAFIKKLINSNICYLPIYKLMDKRFIPYFIIPYEEQNLCSLDNIDYYVNPMPCQLSERMRRKGEVMIWE